MESRHGVSTAIGGALLAFGGSGLLSLFIWAQTDPSLHLWRSGAFDTVIVVLAILTLLGFYALASPLLGLPMPEPRAEPFWRRQDTNGTKVTAPVPRHQITAMPNGTPSTPVQQPAAIPTETGASEGDVRPQERKIVNISPRDLAVFFEHHTDIQAQRLVEPYIGKWMRASARVSEITDYSHLAREPGIAVICVQEQKSPRSLNLTFDKPWMDELRMIKRGDKIRVLGRISQVDAYRLSLDHCELVDQ